MNEDTKKTTEIINGIVGGTIAAAFGGAVLAEGFFKTGFNKFLSAW